MSEKWLLSRCEGYAVRIDEQAPIIDEGTEDERPRKWGAGVSPGGLLVAFGPGQK